MVILSRRASCVGMEDESELERREKAPAMSTRAPSWVGMAEESKFECREKPNVTKLRKAILDCPFKADDTKERLARLGRCEDSKAFLEKLRARLPYGPAHAG